MPTRMRMRNARGAACPRPPVPINRAPWKLMSQAIPVLLRSTARYQVGLINYGTTEYCRDHNTTNTIQQTLNLCGIIIVIIGEQYKNNGIKPRNRIMGKISSLSLHGNALWFRNAVTTKKAFLAHSTTTNHYSEKILAHSTM